MVKNILIFDYLSLKLIFSDDAEVGDILQVEIEYSDFLLTQSFLNRRLRSITETKQMIISFFF